MGCDRRQVEVLRSLGEIYCLEIYCSFACFLLVTCLTYSSTLKAEVMRSFEVLVKLLPDSTSRIQQYSTFHVSH
jgi:hypothetical protein